VEKAFRSLGVITDTILQEAHEYISSEQKTLQEAKALAENTSKAEVTRLQQQNALLTQLLESEKLKADRAKDELLKRISGLLGNFAMERDRSLREAFADMSESNVAAEADMVKLGKEQVQRLDAVIDKGIQWSTALDRRAGENKRTRDGGLKVNMWDGSAVYFLTAHLGYRVYKCYDARGFCWHAEHCLLFCGTCYKQYPAARSVIGGCIHGRFVNACLTSLKTLTDRCFSL
jgi:hypothetical protein